MTTGACPAGEGYSSASADTGEPFDDPLSGADQDDGTCTPCALGKFSLPPSAPRACSWCAAGLAFVNSSTSCTQCGPGTYQEQTAQVMDEDNGNPDVAVPQVCTACPAGFYVGGFGATACGAMTTGDGTDSDGGATCFSGRGYRSTSAEATTTIATAAAGTDTVTGSSADDATCEYCPPGKWKAAQGQSVCVDMGTSGCPAGQAFSSVSAKGRTGTLAGSRLDDGMCADCGVDLWRGNAGAAEACQSCPTGRTTNGVTNANDVADDCLCRPGYGLNASSAANGVTACHACPVDTYKAGANFDECRACPTVSGTQGAMGSTGISACVCETPTISWTPGAQGTNPVVSTIEVTPTTATTPPAAHLCVNTETAPSTGEVYAAVCGSGPSSPCASPSVEYNSGAPLVYTETTTLSVIACGSTGMAPSNIITGTFLVGVPPTVTQTGTGLGPNGVGGGDTFALSTADPTPGAFICAKVALGSTPGESRMLPSSLCNGTTGRCNTEDPDVFRFVPGAGGSPDIVFDVSGTISAATCVSGGAPSSVAYEEVVVATMPPTFDARPGDLGGTAGGGSVAVDIITGAGTPPQLPFSLCFKVLLDPAAPPAGCSAIGDGSECDVGSSAFNSTLLLDGSDQVISAVTCQAGRVASPEIRLRVAVATAPVIEAHERWPDTGVRARVHCGNASLALSECCYAAVGDTPPAGSGGNGEEPAIAACHPNGTRLYEDTDSDGTPYTGSTRCALGSSPIPAGSSDSVVVLAATQVSAVSCAPLTATYDETFPGYVHDAFLPVGSGLASRRIHFSSTPIIHHDSPQQLPGFVSVTFSLPPAASDRRRHRRRTNHHRNSLPDPDTAICYAVTPPSASRTLLPACVPADTLGANSAPGNPCAAASGARLFEPGTDTAVRVSEVGESTVSAIGCDRRHRTVYFPSERSANAVLTIEPAAVDNETGIIAGGATTHKPDQDVNGGGNGDGDADGCSTWLGLCWWWWLIIFLLVCCCGCLLCLCCFLWKRRREKEEKALEKAPAIAIVGAAGGEEELTPRTKLSMMSRMQHTTRNSLVDGLQQTPAVELARMAVTPSHGAGKDDGDRRRHSGRLQDMMTADLLHEEDDLGRPPSMREQRPRAARVKKKSLDRPTIAIAAPPAAPAKKSSLPTGKAPPVAPAPPPMSSVPRTPKPTANPLVAADTATVSL